MSPIEYFVAEQAKKDEEFRMELAAAKDYPFSVIQVSARKWRVIERQEFASTRYGVAIPRFEFVSGPLSGWDALDLAFQRIREWKALNAPNAPEPVAAENGELIPA